MNFLIKNKEIVAGAAGAAALLFGVGVVNAPLWLSFFIGLSLFAGLFLIGSYWWEFQLAQEARALTNVSMQDKVKAGATKVVAIRDLAETIQNPDVQAKVRNICDLADRIFANFEHDPSDLAKAGRFLLYLDRFLPLLERYARLSATPEGRELLAKRSDDEEFFALLDVAEKSFTSGFQNYLENDVVEMRTFGRVLKKMMDVAEVGK
ncbi:MAG: hypothetical protein D6E12_09725 [Desulfovibrio sp.]|nr:MAG: hypothetical protein D6E12_09725 [Desulfovibrio sp.]